jgi:nitrogen-specific signal transduction histidine kinase
MVPVFETIAGYPDLGEGSEETPERSRRLLQRFTADLGELADIIKGKMDGLFAAQKALSQHLKGHSPEVIEDVVEHIKQALDPFVEKGVKIQWKEPPPEGIRLPCDPLVLNDAIFCIVQNARAAAERAKRAPVLQLSVGTRPCPTPSFVTVLELDFTDNGDGVDEAACEILFLDGFSCRHENDPAVNEPHRGRGLALARSQLMAFHGDLRLKDPGGPSGRPQVAADGGPNQPLGGATFSIVFGIRPAARPAGESQDRPDSSGVAHAPQVADR